MKEIMSRFSKYMEIKDLNDNRVTIDCGLSVGLLGRARKDKSDLGRKAVEKILNKYQDLSRVWLLTGEGPMLLTPEEEPPLPVAATKAVPTKPHIPTLAQAGRLNEMADGITESDCEWLPVISTIPQYDFTIQIYGDSMAPEILNGDVVACSFVQDERLLQWGKTYLISTREGVLLKKLYNEADTLRCVSVNQSYPDMHIPRESVLKIASVVGLVRRLSM